MNEEKKKKKKDATTRAKKVLKKEKEVEIDKSKKELHISKKNVNTSSSFNLIEVIIIMIITAVFGVFIGSCVVFFKDNQENVVPDTFKEFIDIYGDIVNEYYYDLDNNGLIEAGIKGMVEYLGDPYSSYLDYDDSTSLNVELEGEYVGMGATISIRGDGYAYIVDMFANSPAVVAGFKIGDRIISVNGEMVTGQNTLEISQKIKGEIGTTVEIVIIRDGEEQSLTLTRGKVVIPSVSYYVVEETNIGVIKIDIFARNTPQQFKDAMNYLIKNGVSSLVIDVRDNSGGYLSSAEKIASYFLDNGDIIYQLEDTKGTVEKIRNNSNKLYDVRVAIVINEASASASEILAVSLKENVDAILVGKKTYGKGTVQKTIQLDSGAMIKYTIQEWLSPNGNRINSVGITPDYDINSDSNVEDTQLEKAIEILKNN